MNRMDEMFSHQTFTLQIYRHGDRNPVQMYPGDQYDISYWPEGWGQLNNVCTI